MWPLTKTFASPWSVCVLMLGVQLLFSILVSIWWRLTILALSFWPHPPCPVYQQHDMDPWIFDIGQWCQGLLFSVLLCGNYGNTRFLQFRPCWGLFCHFSILGCLVQKISLYFLIINPLLYVLQMPFSIFVVNLLNPFKLSFVKKKFWILIKSSLSIYPPHQDFEVILCTVFLNPYWFFFDVYISNPSGIDSCVWFQVWSSFIFFPMYN